MSRVAPASRNDLSVAKTEGTEMMLARLARRIRRDRDWRRNPVACRPRALPARRADSKHAPHADLCRQCINPDFDEMRAESRRRGCNIWLREVDSEFLNRYDGSYA
jgi:hypothetical protein